MYVIFSRRVRNTAFQGQKAQGGDLQLDNEKNYCEDYDVSVKHRTVDLSFLKRGNDIYMCNRTLDGMSMAGCISMMNMSGSVSST